MSDSDTDISDEDDLPGNADEDQRENVMKMWSRQVETESYATPTSPSERPSCPPELKYPALVHILRVKHHLTREATEDLMEIINDISLQLYQKKVLPTDARTITNMHARFLTPSQKHFLCGVCGAYVGTQKSGSRSYVCSLCNSSSSYSNSEYFFYMPLGDQLRQIFEDNFDEISVVLNKRDEQPPHVISSFQDGSLYKEYLKNVNSNELRISRTFSCDGVPVFGSSNSSLWPTLCAIIEAPPPLRKKYLLMPALWYGVNKKPDMNRYLYPFVKETIVLHSRGFSSYHDGQKRVCKVNVLAGLPDSIGRVLLLNVIQFNGEDGCSGCYHPGVQFAKGKGTVRAYPHMSDVSRRTSEETKELAKEAASLKQRPYAVKGIKGETVLSHIPLFDLIKGMPPDYLHCSVLGVARQFARLWFESTYHGKEFYIGLAKDEINLRLSNFRVPFIASRGARTLKDFKFWKGHELYFWCLIYSPVVLKGVLPNKYLRHWMLFVEGLFLLLQESVAKSQVHNAGEMLVQFSRGTEELYGLEHCSFNVHLNEHLADSVIECGPLWEHSAFIYEDYNQTLLKAIRSSKGVLDQVVNQVLTARSIPSLLSTPVGSAFIEMNVTKRDKKVSTENSISCRNGNCSVIVLAPIVNETVSDELRLASASLDVRIARGDNLLVSKRMIAHRVVFHSKLYIAAKTRNSFTVILSDGNMFAVEKCVIVRTSCYAVGRYLEFDKRFTFVPNRPSLPFHFCVKKNSGPVRVVDVANFMTKVLFLSCDHLPVNIVCVLPNRVEVLH